MKVKSLIASMCFLCLGYSASAQMYGGSSTATAGGAGATAFGVRAGATFASLKSSNGNMSIETDNTVGLQFGAIANFGLSDLISIQPELLFVQKGGQMSFDRMKQKQTLNYLEVPVLAKVSFGTNMLKGYVTGGPTVAYWLSGEASNGSETRKINFDEEEDVNRLEAGLSFGVGAEYGQFGLDLRYGLGLTNLEDIEEGSIRNRVIGLSLSYMFGR